MDELIALGADPGFDGFAATGGDLSVPTLVHAYRRGMFPWFDQDTAIAWWCPSPRCVVIPSDFVPAKSLVRAVKKGAWVITVNHAFDKVITGCSQPRAYTDDTWIHRQMIDAYQALHEAGVAVSIEVWQEVGDGLSRDGDSQLIGGLYGLLIGQVFFGESMFHVVRDASKAAFWALNTWCESIGVKLIDCQLVNNHLLSLGAQAMTQAEFFVRLQTLINQANTANDSLCTFGLDQVV